MPPLSVTKPIVSQAIPDRRVQFAANIARSLGQQIPVSTTPLTEGIHLGPSLIAMARDRAGEVTTLAQQMAAEGAGSTEINRAVQQLKNARDRAAVGGPGKDKSIIGRIKGVSGDIVSDIGSGLGKGLDLLSRPGQAVEAIVEDRLKGITEAIADGVDVGDIDDFFTNINPAFTDPSQLMAAAKALAGKNKEGGQGILNEAANLLDELGAEGAAKFTRENDVFRGLAGLGLDIGLDPTMVAGVGLAGAIGKGGKLALKIDDLARMGTSRTVAKTALEAIDRIQEGSRIRTGAFKGVKKLNSGDVKTVINAAQDTARAEITSPLNQVTRQVADEAKQAAINKGLGPQEVIAARKRAIQGLIDSKADDVNRILDKALKPYQKRRVAFHVAGKDLLENSKFAASLFDPARKGVDVLRQNFRGLNQLDLAFRLEKVYPGAIQAARRMATSMGLKGMDEFSQQVVNLFKGIDRETRIELAHGIERGTDFGNRQAANGRLLNDVRDDAKNLFRAMGDDEIDAGLRKVDDLAKDRYVYHFYKNRGRAIDAQTFRSQRKEMIQTTGQIGNMTLEEAALKGLKPEQDLAKILMAKKAKSSRDFVRHWLDIETMTAYGRAMKPLSRAEQYGLVDVTNSLSSKTWKDIIPQGEVMYLPKEYFDAIQAAKGTMKIGEDLAGFWHSLDTMNRWFKYSKTLLRPGYHVNNMSSDMMMNWWDGVSLRDYGPDFSRWMGTNPTGQKLGFKVKPYKYGGYDVPYEDVRDLFDRFAQGGNLFDVDVPKDLRPTVPGMRETPQRLLNTLRQWSSNREDFARYVHFNKGLKQEFKSRLKGRKNLSKLEVESLLEESATAAAARVSKSNIDYMAVTPFEQNVMKRVIPFYTYMRKATPLILETAFLKPGKFTALNKGKTAVETALGIEPGDDFQGLGSVNIPEWLGGSSRYLQVSNAMEFPYLDLSALPQNYVAQQFGGTSNFGDFMTRNVGMLNPGLRGPFELAAGKTLFGGKAVTNPLDWAEREFAPWSPVKGTLERKEDAYKGWNLAGIPIRKLSEDQQVSAIKQRTMQPKETIARLNASLKSKGLEISTSNRKTGVVYRLLDRANGTEIGVFDSPAEAQRAANRRYPG